MNKRTLTIAAVFALALAYFFLTAGNSAAQTADFSQD